MFRIAAAALALSFCAAPALAQDPPQAFQLQCRFCHDDDSLAPSLAGVFGRKAGSTSFDYSPALKGKDVVWDEASLDAFLKNPQEFAPGTKMGLSVPDDAARKQIVDYLKTLK
jgi:cytochrome c